MYKVSSETFIHKIYKSLINVSTIGSETRIVMQDQTKTIGYYLLALSSLVMVIPFFIFQANAKLAESESVNREVVGQLNLNSDPLPMVEWEKRQNADERLTSFGDDIFGDKIDPHTGGISFENTDIVLPGNSKK